MIHSHQEPLLRCCLIFNAALWTWLWSPAKWPLLSVVTNASVYLSRWNPSSRFWEFKDLSASHLTHLPLVRVSPSCIPSPMSNLGSCTLSVGKSLSFGWHIGWPLGLVSWKLCFPPRLREPREELQIVLLLLASKQYKCPFNIITGYTLVEN